MLGEPYELNINEDREEKTIRGTQYFPCTCYRGDIQKYFMGYLPVHWHNEFEFFHLDEGSVKVVGEAVEFDLQAGEGYFSNSGALHGIYPLGTSPCLFHSIVFDTSIIGGTPGSAFDLLYVKPFIEHAFKIFPFKRTDERLESMNAAFEYTHENCVREPKNYEFFVRQGLSEMFLLLIQKQDMQMESTVRGQVVRIKQMAAWMEDNYSEDITIAMIADSASISVRECQRSFQEIMHTSPMHYLTNIRIAKAMSLLRENAAAISEIALNTGFGSSSYFTKQFKHIVGKTPSQYRMSAAAD